MDIGDLTHSLDYGDTFAQTASFLCRRQKAKERGLVEQPSKRRVVLDNKYSHTVISRISATPIPINVNATAPRCSSRIMALCPGLRRLLAAPRPVSFIGERVMIGAPVLGLST
jgi:hypothetical protein